MDNQQGTLVTEAELGWLAGIIDGEGTIAFSVMIKHRRQDVSVKPQIIVTNTDPAMIEKVADILGRLGVGAHVSVREPRYPGFAERKCKLAHVVNVAGFKRAGKLLAIIVPLLVTSKKQKGEMVLRYIRQRLAKTVERGRWAGLDVDDLQSIHEIIAFASKHNGKGPRARNADEIERLLRDFEQDGRPSAA